MVGITAAACSGGGDVPVADPASSAPSTTAEAETETESAEATTPTPTPTPTTGVEAATGEEVTFNGMKLRVPQNYEVFDTFSSGMSARGRDDSFSRMSVLSADAIGIAQPLKVALSDFLENNQYLQKPKTLDPVIVDGVEMFHVAGPIDPVSWLEGYGVATEDYYYFFEFYFQESSTTTKERRRVVGSILATVELTE